MLPFFLSQLPLLAAAAFGSLGLDTACHATSNTAAQCLETASTNCRSLYDVLTEFDKERCQAVCEALAGTCTGFTINADRCDIWKAPILASSFYVGSQCFNGTKPEGRDATLHFSFDLVFSNLDWEKVRASDGTHFFGGLVSMATKAAVKSVYKASKAPSKIAEGKLRVFFDAESEQVTVGMQPGTTAERRTALVMYALLRRSEDFQDGTTPGLLGKLTEEALPQSLAQIPDLKSWLADGGPVFVEVSNRRLGTSLPLDNIPMASKERWKTMHRDGHIVSTVASTSMVPTTTSKRTVSKARVKMPAARVLLTAALGGLLSVFFCS